MWEYEANFVTSTLSEMSIITIVHQKTLQLLDARLGGDFTDE